MSYSIFGELWNREIAPIWLLRKDRLLQLWAIEGDLPVEIVSSVSFSKDYRTEGWRVFMSKRVSTKGKIPERIDGTV